MNAADVVAWTHDGSVYCLECAPKAGLPKSYEQQEQQEWGPVFASSEWDYWPVCDECSNRIEDVGLTSEGVDYELEQANVEIFEVSQTEADDPDHFAHDPDYGAGWYYWTCLPGCLPDSEPTGPFSSYEKAREDAAEHMLY